jgi:hypothetical protein
MTVRPGLRAAMRQGWIADQTLSDRISPRPLSDHGHHFDFDQSAERQGRHLHG